ncbi:MAG: hypothetical protein MJE66_17935 [Proteobacteria bacterium]|nr:hypothetical protein [Pseudomonadota bacterium]
MKKLPGAAKAPVKRPAGSETLLPPTVETATGFGSCWKTTAGMRLLPVVLSTIDSVESSIVAASAGALASNAPASNSAAEPRSARAFEMRRQNEPGEPANRQKLGIVSS